MLLFLHAIRARTAGWAKAPVQDGQLCAEPGSGPLQAARRRENCTIGRSPPLQRRKSWVNVGPALWQWAKACSCWVGAWLAVMSAGPQF